MAITDQPVQGDEDRDEDAFGAAMLRYAQAERPGARLAAELARFDAEDTEVRELSPRALERQQRFVREGERFAELSDEMSVRLLDRFADHWSLFDRPEPLQPRDLMHVFGPDVNGTGSADFYRLTWGSVDGGPRTSAGIRPDPRTGTFSASQYWTGNSSGYSYCGLGVRFTPRSHLCTLSVRPLVQWSGFSILQHRQYDPDLEAHAWAQSLAAIGVHVQSRPIGGGPVHDDAGRWETVWNTSQRDPNNFADYDGTETSQSIGVDGVFATDERETLVWVSCQAFALSQSVFNLDTRANSSISCRMPYLVVEEIPLV